MATFDLALLARQIDSLRYRLETARQDANQSLAESSTRTNLYVWSNAIDELSACQEALFQQQDELTIALRTVKEERQRYQWEVQLQPTGHASLSALITVTFIPAATGLDSVLWLIHAISAQKWAEEELHRASHELAQQVADRTAQLVAANKTLQTEITARQHAQTQEIENERLAVLGVTAEKVAHEIGNALNIYHRATATLSSQPPTCASRRNPHDDRTRFTATASQAERDRAWLAFPRALGTVAGRVDESVRPHR